MIIILPRKLQPSFHKAFNSLIIYFSWYPPYPHAQWN